MNPGVFALDEGKGVIDLTSARGVDLDAVRRMGIWAWREPGLSGKILSAKRGRCVKCTTRDAKRFCWTFVYGKWVCRSRLWSANSRSVLRNVLPVKRVGRMMAAEPCGKWS